MKAEQWLNRADHELALARELVNAGSLLWAASYAHRAVEYLLEGYIVLKTGSRPERGCRLPDLQQMVQHDLPGDIAPAIAELVSFTPQAWQSDIPASVLVSLTEPKVRSLITGAEKALDWVGTEWERVNSEEKEGRSAPVQ